MNEEKNSIYNEALPISQSFTRLKQEGIRHITDLNGHLWTNFNESDPGVTILDQVCYALTELGYVSDFSIEDVLTKKNGTISHHNQFFTKEILTSAPITSQDYCKYVLEKLPAVSFISIEHIQNGLYQTYFEADTEPHIEKSLHQILNNNRNVNEYFLYPKKLIQENIDIKCNIVFDSGSDLNTAIETINAKLNLYTHSSIQVQNICNDEVLTKNPNGNKRNQIVFSDVLLIISSINEVLEITQFQVQYPDTKSCLVSAGKIANIRLSINGKAYAVTEKVQEQPHFDISQLKGAEPHKTFGKFRNIESYYSVQHSFPAVYSVGDNSFSNADSHSKALSRQLQGYLFLIDQMLANQFSQLAHLDSLFSFAFSLQDKQEHFDFTNTYFYQTIYDVPGADALLSGLINHEYLNQTNIVNNEESRLFAWENFKKNSLNSYKLGLADIIYSTIEDIENKDDILNHLLARHGEPVDIYNEMIDTSAWVFRNKLLTRVVLKSAYLQHLEPLSCRRAQATSFISASELSSSYFITKFSGYEITSVLFGSVLFPSLDYLTNHNLCDDILDFQLSGLFDSKEKITEVKTKITSKIPKNLKDHSSNTDYEKVLQQLNAQNDCWINGKLNPKQLQNVFALTQKDFDNFSSFELLSSFFVGVDKYLKNLANKLIRLLLNNDFINWLNIYINTIKKTVFTESKKVINGITCLVTLNEFKISRRGHFSINLPRNEYAMMNLKLYIDQLIWLGKMRKGFLFIEHTLLNGVGDCLITPCQSASFVVPSYLVSEESYMISLLQSLAQLTQLNMPAQLNFQYRKANLNEMNILITTYCKWFNENRRICNTKKTKEPKNQLNQNTDNTIFENPYRQLLAKYLDKTSLIDGIA